MLEFNREIINGSFNKVNKAGKEVDYVNINIKTREKNVDVKFAGKGVWVAGAVAMVPICVLGATVAVCAISRAISKRKKIEERE